MSEIRLVVFDWAGTTVDHGCFAPVASFVEAFRTHGVEVSPAEARGPMGLHKKDHIRELLRMPGVGQRWRTAHGSNWTEGDVEAIFQTFIPLQMNVIERYSDLVPGLLTTVAELKRRGIKMGGTTGYFRASAEAVAIAARRQGYAPDVTMCPDDVPTGRPAPWMIYHIMQETGIYPPSAVLKIGDTVPDIDEGRNAGCWSVGVTRTGSEVGLTEREWDALDRAERRTKTEPAATKLKAAGAHAVIPSVAELPDLMDEINSLMRRGERP
ncbi:MAG: phosphonoacetaldehyde hydrolase [Gemmataceae bacterium]